MAVCRTGSQYRQFFAWLLRTIRRLNDDNPAAATEAAAIRVDSSDIASFLDGQFEVDVIGPELWVSKNKGSALPQSCKTVLLFSACCYASASWWYCVAFVLGLASIVQTQCNNKQ